MTKIDQIMIRNLGGWNMISKHEWQNIKPKARLRLVTENKVQFFSDGNQVDTMTALQELSFNSSPPNEQTTPPIPATQATKADNAFELKPQKFVSAVYSRLVITGPFWQVQRSTPDTPGEPFSEIRKRADDNEYDLDRPDGSKLLIADLIADAHGIGVSLDTALPNKAIDHFDETYFSTNLGDRFWEVSASDIRAQTTANPHIEVLKPSEI